MDYSKYKFNYFDVVKRHERIINRPKDWEIKVLACIMLFVTFCYVFSSGVFAAETENVELTIVNGISVSNGRNYFATSSTGVVGYFQTEKGYIYHIYKTAGSSAASIVGSESAPSVNVEYEIFTTIDRGQTYDYLSNSDNLICISFNTYEIEGGYSISVTREKIASQENAVNQLVDNVGVNQMWGVFENGIDFVGVVVLVAFGLFLVVLAIKKVSKGKSEF